MAVYRSLFQKHINKLICHLLFFRSFKRILHLKHPKTFNEKIQYLKLAQRTPFFTMLTDKYRVREYVREKAGAKYLSTLYGAYDSVEELQADQDRLPQSFVLKTNHWSGKVWRIKDKQTCDWKQIHSELRTLLGRNYYWQSMRGLYIPNGEWVYKDIAPKILCEEYLQEAGSAEEVPNDYKIFCFDGVVQYIQVHIGRFSDHHTRCFYNTNWEKQPGIVPGYFYAGEVQRPAQLAEMIAVAKSLSQGMPHVRVDLYCPDSERIVFGEMALYHGAGLESFYHGSTPKAPYPDDWDVRLGELIRLESGR